MRRWRWGAGEAEVEVQVEAGTGAEAWVEAGAEVGVEAGAGADAVDLKNPIGHDAALLGVDHLYQAEVHLAYVASNEHREGQVAVALVGGVGHAVLEGARL